MKIDEYGRRVYHSMAEFMTNRPIHSEFETNIVATSSWKVSFSMGKTAMENV